MSKTLRELRERARQIVAECHNGKGAEFCAHETDIEVARKLMACMQMMSGCPAVFVEEAVAVMVADIRKGVELRKGMS